MKITSPNPPDRTGLRGPRRAGGRAHGVALLAAALAAAFLPSAPPAHAQTPAATQQPAAAPDAEGELIIEQVTVRYVGLQNLSENVAFSHLRARRGLVLTQALLDQDVRSLYGTGLFEGIQVRQQVEGSTVRLVYELQPKFRISSVSFSGNDQLKNKRLQKEIQTASGQPLDERRIKADTRALTELYQKQGFSKATVDYTIQRDQTTGRATVTFRIDEGEKIKITAIEFEGNEALKDKKLRGTMETRKWWMLSWLLGSGRFEDDTFAEDLDKVRDEYREAGYLDATIDRDNIRFEYPQPDELVITIPVTEGRQYRVGGITITGATLFPEAALRRLLRVSTGDVFVPSLIDKDVTALRDQYGRNGYLETEVRLLRRPNVESGAIDLEYAIEEGPRFEVESIRIDGNTKTKSLVIARELALRPGDVFDTVRMKISEARLRNTRFFEEDVSLAPESTNVPGRKNLKVELSEGRTGNFSFGAGFSSVESLVFFAEVTQSNFDIFNWRGGFQGDGQKLRLRFQIGEESNEIILSFEEPWLFERELALGFSVFRQSAAYASDFYDELRAGFEVYLRKRLIELVEGRVSYSWQTITYENASSAILIANDEYTISKIGLTLLRDTRDDIVVTRRGNRLEFLGEIAGDALGLGGTEDIYRLELRGSQFFPLWDFQRQSLGFVARSGVVEAYGRNEIKYPIDGATGEFLQVPLAERYYLGGPNDLRGFEFREVGPVDPLGRRVGGKTFGLFSAEYSLDLVDPIRFAVFYDWGFVNRDGFDWDPGDYNDNWGFGLRIFVMGAPLRLDYGIPITTDEGNDNGGQFNFSFGTRF